MTQKKPSKDPPLVSPPRKKALEELNRAMSTSREELAQLQQELQSDEALLQEARRRYSQVSEALGELNRAVEERRQRAFALKVQLQGKQGARRALESGRVTGGGGRAQPRLPFTLHVNFGGLSEHYSGFAVNLSAGGMLVATCDPPPLGTRFAVEFDLDASTTIRAPVEAVWVHYVTERDEAGLRVAEVGLRFLGMSNRDKQAVQRFADAAFAKE